MSEPLIPTKQREKARLWLAKADEDLAAVAAMLALNRRFRASPPTIANRPAEKLLKGLLTAYAAPFRKTHDLD